MDDYKDENILSFLDMMYFNIKIQQDNTIGYTIREFYKEFYDSLKAFQDGEW